MGKYFSKKVGNQYLVIREDLDKVEDVISSHSTSKEANKKLDKILSRII